MENRERGKPKQRQLGKQAKEKESQMDVCLNTSVDDVLQAYGVFELTENNRA